MIYLTLLYGNFTFSSRHAVRYLIKATKLTTYMYQAGQGPTNFSNVHPSSGKPISSSPSWSREGLSNPEFRHVGTKAKARRKRPTPVFNTYIVFDSFGEGLNLTTKHSYFSLSVSVFLALYTHTALAFMPICFTPFSFNIPSKFIPLFNLRCLFSV